MHWQPFTPSDLHRIALQPAQQQFAAQLDNGYAKALMDAGPAWSAVQEDKVLVCAGLVPLWEGRSQIWSLIAADAGPYFIRLVRGMRTFLDLQDVRRIEAAVATEFPQGHRLARMLGFVREGTMRGYAPGGRDHDLYALVR